MMFKNSNFTLSVIIPIYNAAFFLEKAVESALNQPEVSEVILIEDGSSDESLEVCRELSIKFNKIKLFQHPDKGNQGASASRNLGIHNSNADYVSFLDADDQYLPGRFNRDKEIFLSDDTIEGVYSASLAHALDDDGENRLEKINNLLTIKEPISHDKLFENMSPVGNAGFFFLNALTVKKTVFQKTGFFDVRLRLSQDTDFCIKLAAVCKLCPGDLINPVVLYGLHYNNRSKHEDVILANRPDLFYNLFTWGKGASILKGRIFLLWQRFYEYNLLIKKPSRKTQLLLLLKEFYRYPFLLKSPFFLKQLPVIHRFIK